MTRRPTFTLDEYDLSAHGTMMVRLYGYEPVSVREIRGEDVDRADCTLSIKHLRLVGSPKVLLATLEASVEVLRQVIDHPERWNELFTRRLAKGLDTDGPEPLSPFWALPGHPEGNEPDVK